MILELIFENGKGEYVCDEEFIFSDDCDVVGGITMFIMTIE
jgi:hypothetical protein